jgi:GTP-binding protein Era
MTDGKELKTNHEATLETIRKMDHVPVILLINKIDLLNQEQVVDKIAYWQEQVPHADVMPVSALHKFNIEKVFDSILQQLPEAPPYFDKDQLTDRPLRFFVSEIIREKIFLHYEKEIPYSSEVIVESYKEEGQLARIRALIMVERDSQKNIIIGKGGAMLKRVGTEARLEIEAFIGMKVFLETFVKVDKAWRSKENRLKYYGYSE